MIEELSITSLGVIEEARLELSPGLTVVTGETGAGKTMLVTALQLLLGGRGDASLVRHGSTSARVEARVSPVPPTASDWADDDDQDLVVGRELRVEGRSRVRIAGRMAPVGALAEVLGPEVEVHGQDEHVRLRQPDVQRMLLDRYAGEPHAVVMRRHAAAWAELAAARARRDELVADARERLRRTDQLRAEADDIDAAELDLEADGAIDVELSLLEHAEDLTEALDTAAAAIGHGGAREAIARAVETLGRVPVEDPSITELRDRAASLLAESDDLGLELRHRGYAVEVDPHRLDRLRSRRRRLTELFRRYGPDVETVLSHRAAVEDELDQLRAAADDADGLDRTVEELTEAVEVTAQAVTAGRRRAAEALADAVDALLGPLGMPHARFRVDLEPATPGATGADRVSFLLAANPGQPPLPVHQAASGGERSRIALAIEVALADVEGASVLVFDEVDAGVGGATALSVGEQLRALAHGPRPRQVLCVTHLAQLAAFADVHHVVEKGLEDGRTVTRVRQVTEDSRVAELARMLGGTSSDEGMAHARTLLDRAAA